MSTVYHGMLRDHAVWIAQVWYYRLKRACIRADGSRGLVVDVGGNFGWYSLFAAAMGCRVIAWEPVPHFRDFFSYGVAVNGFENLIQVSKGLEAEGLRRLWHQRIPVHIL